MGLTQENSSAANHASHRWLQTNSSLPRMQKELRTVPDLLVKSIFPPVLPKQSPSTLAHSGQKCWFEPREITTAYFCCKAMSRMDLHSGKWKRKSNAPPLSGYAELLLRSGYSGKYFHDDCDLGQSSRSADPGYEPLILGRANCFETPESVSYIPCAQRLESLSPRRVAAPQRRRHGMLVSYSSLRRLAGKARNCACGFIADCPPNLGPHRIRIWILSE